MNIAIIDDEKEQSDRLEELLASFLKETDEKITFDVEVYNCSNRFIDNYIPRYDIIFLDIAMPGIDGMTLAKKIREKDVDVKLIFVTQMAQYAIEGYQVMAYDYLVKPISKNRFFSLMKRCIRRIEENREDTSISIKTQYGQANILLKNIRYVEVKGHLSIIHADKEYQTWMSLSKVEDILPKEKFFRISSYFIVNLRYVKEVSGYDVYLNRDVLTVSRDKKKEFIKALTASKGV